MRNVLSALQDIILFEIRQGKVIDIDDCCRRTLSEYPGLDRTALREEIFRIVTSAGGNAVWGEEGEVRKLPPK